MLRKLPAVTYTVGSPATPDVTTCTPPPLPPPSPPPSPPPASGGATCVMGYGTIPYCLEAPYSDRLFDLPPGVTLLTVQDGPYTRYWICVQTTGCLDSMADLDP